MASYLTLDQVVQEVLSDANLPPLSELRQASASALRKWFRTALAVLHPDKSSLPAPLLAKKTDLFKAVSEIKEVVLSPQPWRWKVVPPGQARNATGGGGTSATRGRTRSRDPAPEDARSRSRSRSARSRSSTGRGRGSSRTRQSSASRGGGARTAQSRGSAGRGSARRRRSRGSTPSRGRGSRTQPRSSAGRGSGRADPPEPRPRRGRPPNPVPPRQRSAIDFIWQCPMCDEQILCPCGRPGKAAIHWRGEHFGVPLSSQSSSYARQYGWVACPHCKLPFAGTAGAESHSRGLLFREFVSLTFLTKYSSCSAERVKTNNIDSTIQIASRSHASRGVHHPNLTCDNEEVKGCVKDDPPRFCRTAVDFPVGLESNELSGSVEEDRPLQASLARGRSLPALRTRALPVPALLGARPRRRSTRRRAWPVSGVAPPRPVCVRSATVLSKPV